MSCKIISIIFVLSVTLLIAAAQSNGMAADWAGQAASSSGPVGKPQFHVNGGGAGRDSRNWGAHMNAGAGVKVWESQNGRHSVGAGANYGRSFGRFDGRSWSGRPDIGVGAGYTYRFGRRRG